MGLFSGIGTAIGGAIGGPIGAAIGGGAGALLDGSSSGGSQTTTTTQRTDFKQLRKDAEKGGFNPLTALRATGGGGTTTTTVSAPGLSSTEFIGSALAGAIGGYQSYDPMAEKKAQLELDLMTAELERMQSSAGVNAGFPAAPTMRTAGGMTTKTNGNGSQTLAGGSALPDALGVTMEKVEVEPVASIPLTVQNRSGAKGGRPWWGLNPDAFDIGLSELVGGGLMHGGAYVINRAPIWAGAAYDRIKDEAKFPTNPAKSGRMSR